MRRCSAINFKSAKEIGQCSKIEGNHGVGSFYGKVCKVHAHMLWTSMTQGHFKRYKVLTRTFKELDIEQLKGIVEDVRTAKSTLQIDWVDITSLMHKSYLKINN